MVYLPKSYFSMVPTFDPQFPALNPYSNVNYTSMFLPFLPLHNVRVKYFYKNLPSYFKNYLSTTELVLVGRMSTDACNEKSQVQDYFLIARTFAALHNEKG